jgi:hypothetical protein
MEMFWLFLILVPAGIMLWCCLALSGDIAEVEERERGVRRS